MTIDHREDLKHWMDLWDAKSIEFAKEQAEQQAQRHPPSPYDGSDFADKSGWGDLLNRSQNLDYNPNSNYDDGMLNDHKKIKGNKINEGEAPVSKKGGIRDLTKDAVPGSKNVNYQTNPQTPWSIGNDQEGEDGHVRVTDNWSSGKELLELDQLKRDVEQMERDFHIADVRRTGNRSKFETDLNGLRQRIQDLSERMQSRFDLDVT